MGGSGCWGKGRLHCCWSCCQKVLIPAPSPAAATRPSFHTDPSGTFVKFEAKAIGSGSEGAQTSLQEAWRADLTLAEAEVVALSTLKQVMEEKVRLGVAGCLAGCTQGVVVGGGHAAAEAAGGVLGTAPACCCCWRWQYYTRQQPDRCRELTPCHPAACLPASQVTATNVDIAKVAPKWHLYSPAEVEAVIARL